MIDIAKLSEDFEAYYDRRACPIISASYDGPRIYVRFHHPDYGSTSFQFDPKTLVADGHDREEQPVRLRKKARSVVRDVWFLRVGRADWDKDEWIELTEKFHGIEEAKERLNTIKNNFNESNSGYSVRLRKDTEMADVYDFDQWAQYRFESGDWRALPWANEPWIKPELAHHFPHHGKYDDTQVAYWETPSEAQRDNIATVTGGRYLERFYSDVLTPSQIQDWVLKLDPPGELEFSGSDPEAIYQAYDSADASGLHSCMVYRDSQDCHDGVRWRSDGKSPVRVYGAGDLEIATLVRNGRRVGRALVWPERKAAGRMYGDIGRMTLALKQAGYEHDGGWTNNDMHTDPKGLLAGARILKIPVTAHPGNFAMPYIDFNYGLRDEGDHFILDKFSPKAQRTDGLWAYVDDDDEQGSGFNCDCCGDWESEDDQYTVYHGTREQYWCYSCSDNRAISCDNCNDQHSTATSATVGGQDWCEHCVNAHAADCHECDDTIDSRNAEPIRGSRGGNIGHLCDGCVPDNDDTAAYTRIDGTLYQSSDVPAEEHA